MLTSIITREGGVGNYQLFVVDGETGAIVSQKYVAPLTGFAPEDPSGEFFFDTGRLVSSDESMEAYPQFMVGDSVFYVITPIPGSSEVDESGINGFALLPAAATRPSPVPATLFGGASPFFFGESYRTDPVQHAKGVYCGLYDSGNPIDENVTAVPEFGQCFITGSNITASNTSTSAVLWRASVAFADGHARLVSHAINDSTGVLTISISEPVQVGWNPSTVAKSYVSVVAAVNEESSDADAEFNAASASIAQELIDQCAVYGQVTVFRKPFYPAYIPFYTAYSVWSDIELCEVVSGGFRLVSGYRSFGGLGP